MNDKKIVEWIEKHSAYDSVDIYTRWKSGRILSDGQKRDIDLAIAYSKDNPGAALAAQRKTETKICPSCGQTFTGLKRAEFCPKCSNKARQARWRAKQKQHG